MDVGEPGFTARNLEFYRLDVRSASLVEVLRGCDALIHLATSYGSGDEAHDVVVGGTRNALRAAAEAGVPHVVVRSAVEALGAHPDNDYPLTEGSPLRPIPASALSLHRAEAEEVAGAFAEENPSTAVAVLRMAPGLDASDGLGVRLLGGTVAVRVQGYDAEFQLLDPSDAARALEFAVDRRLGGVFHVCPDDRVTLSEAVRTVGAREVVVTHQEADVRIARLAKMRLTTLDPSEAPFLMYPWAMSGAKLAELGFSCERTSRDVLSAAAAAAGTRVIVGPVRARPRDLVMAALGAAALAGGLARRRARRTRA